MLRGRPRAPQSIAPTQVEAGSRARTRTKFLTSQCRVERVPGYLEMAGNLFLPDEALAPYPRNRLHDQNPLPTTAVACNGATSGSKFGGRSPVQGTLRFESSSMRPPPGLGSEIRPPPQGCERHRSSHGSSCRLFSAKRTSGRFSRSPGQTTVEQHRDCIPHAGSDQPAAAPQQPPPAPSPKRPEPECAPENLTRSKMRFPIGRHMGSPGFGYRFSPRRKRPNVRAGGLRCTSPQVTTTVLARPTRGSPRHMRPLASGVGQIIERRRRAGLRSRASDSAARTPVPSVPT